MSPGRTPLTVVEGTVLTSQMRVSGLRLYPEPVTRDPTAQRRRETWGLSLLCVPVSRESITLLRHISTNLESARQLLGIFKNQEV